MCCTLCICPLMCIFGSGFEMEKDITLNGEADSELLREFKPGITICPE